MIQCYQLILKKFHVSPEKIDYYRSFTDSNFAQIMNSNQDILISDNGESTSLMYFNSDVSEFAIKNFGFFAAYFLSNWIDRFSQNVTAPSNELFQNISFDTLVLGIHFRSDNDLTQKYMVDVESALNIVFSFADLWMNRNNGLIVIAADSQEIIQRFSKRYGKNLLFIQVSIRGSDIAFSTAFLDLEVLLNCNEYIGTFRSTFSHIVSIRSLIPTYFFERSGLEIWKSQNSQLGSIITFFESEHDHWCVQEMINVPGPNILSLRYFYKYFLI